MQARVPDARLPHQLRLGLCLVCLASPRNCSSGEHRISRDLWCGQILDGGLQRDQHDCVAAHWLGTGCWTGHVARGPRGASTTCMRALVPLSARTALSPSLVSVCGCVLVDAEKSDQGSSKDSRISRAINEERLQGCPAEASSFAWAITRRQGAGDGSRGRRVEGETEGGVMCRGCCKVRLFSLDGLMLRRMPVRSYFCWLPHQPGPSWRRIRT